MMERIGWSWDNLFLTFYVKGGGGAGRRDRFLRASPGQLRRRVGRALFNQSTYCQFRNRSVEKNRFGFNQRLKGTANFLTLRIFFFPFWHTTFVAQRKEL